MDRQISAAVAVTARALCVPAGDIRSSRGGRRVVNARHTAMAVALAMTGAPPRAVALGFGFSASMAEAVKRTGRHIECHPEYRRFVADLAVDAAVAMALLEEVSS